MAIEGKRDGVEPIRGPSGASEVRRVAASSVLAAGTLACPSCDAPVSPGAGPRAPSDALACPYCGHGAALRDFLSLAAPSRPAHVEVRVVRRAR